MVDQPLNTLRLGALHGPEASIVAQHVVTVPALWSVPPLARTGAQPMPRGGDSGRVDRAAAPGGLPQHGAGKVRARFCFCVRLLLVPSAKPPHISALRPPASGLEPQNPATAAARPFSVLVHEKDSGSNLW
jgi:hypothetical protein